MSKMPVLFLSHGSPMHAIQPSAAADAWAAEAAALPRPRAILIISAHWETRVPMLGGGERQETIHDFGGFPDALYRILYPAPGEPALAARAAALLRDAGTTAGVDATRGLDHGAWVPLLKMYPQADLPVVQLSVQPELDARHHLELGRALAPLRDEGVLIIGSGHMTHNLRDWMMSARGLARPDGYAEVFRDWVAAKLSADDLPALLDWTQQAPQARRAHPTPEHFLPLFVAAGAGQGSRAERFHASMEEGVLAMDAWRWQ